MAIKSLAAVGAIGMFANKTLGKGLLPSGKGSAGIGSAPSLTPKPFAEPAWESGASLGLFV